jgi:hypothetical protein
MRRRQRSHHPMKAMSIGHVVYFYISFCGMKITPRYVIPHFIITFSIHSENKCKL